MADVGKQRVALPYINKLTFKVEIGASSDDTESHPSPGRLKYKESQVTVTGPSPRKQTHRKSKKNLGPVPLSDLLESRVSVDTEDEWIVESPRKIQFEKTMVGMKTNLYEPLQHFYEETVDIPEKKLTQVRSKSNALVGYLMPRLTKLANQAGMKITGHYFGGSTFDDTAVVLPYEIDIFILIDKGKTTLDSMEGGYRVIPLRRFQEKAGHPPDPYRYGRSDSGLYLSSLRIARVTHELVDRALRLNSSTTLEEFSCDGGRHQISITMKRFTFNIIPAIYLSNEEAYLVSQPYAYDSRPWHELAWRVSYVEKERKMMDIMDKADRGARRKAYKILKAFVRVEHTLDGLTSYHIKTVLLHTFDSNVDSTPRWQRDPVETAFLELLRRLRHYLSMRILPHFFIDSYNLFHKMAKRRLASLHTRVGYLVDNESEIIRILRKRSE